MSDIRNFFKKPSTTPTPASKKRTREEKDENEEEFVVTKVTPKPVNKKPVEKISPPAKATAAPSPLKKIKTKEVEPEEKKKRLENYKSFINRGGPSAPGSKSIPDGEKNCLKDLTFVFTGVLDSLDRDEGKALVEKYGGRVTTAISGKTKYLIAGRDTSEGKLSKAREMKVEVISEDDLLEMIRTRPGDEKSSTSKATPVKPKQTVSTTTKKSKDEPEPAITSKSKRTPSTASKKSTDEPDEPAVVPKAKRTASTVTKKSTNESEPSVTSKPIIDDSNLLWADKYKPQTIKDLVGQQGDKSCVHKLIVWLRDWYKHHGQADEKVKAKPSFGFNRNENPAMFKAALLSGPPGIGKTTAAQLVCQHLNYEYIEKNASDQRSKKSMTTLSSDTYSIAHFTEKSMLKHVLIMDEVDGVAGNEDRGGIQELIALIKRSRIPVICICNDRQHKKIRSLANYCYDLRFYRPNLVQIRTAMSAILQRENIHHIKQDILDEIIQTCNQDIRQTIHSLNLWTIESVRTNSSAAKMIEKNVNSNPFELCRLSFSDELRSKSLTEKSDIFFYDYQLMPLLIQENYLQCQPHLSSGEKRKITDLEHLQLISKAADQIALGDICSQMIYSRNESWSLLPYQGIFSTVAPCSYVRGHLRGMVNFSSFFGQRSRTNKNERLINEIEKHICLRTASANKQQFNLDYLPYLSRILISPLKQLSNEQGIEQCIQLLDDYYLNRDDFQTMMELNTWGKTDRNPYEQLDTQLKSSLTRNYNKSKHRTPYAIVDIKKLKKAKDLSEDEDEGEDDQGNGEEQEGNENIQEDAMIKLSKRPTVTKKTRKK